MSFSVKPRHVPQRLAAGAFILASGMSKRGADAGTANYLHQGAVTAYPQFEKMNPQLFARLLSAGEITLGAALLAPFVPTGLAAAGLTAFSGSLVRMYLRTPGARQEGSLAPTEEGIPMAKDAWMLGMGVGMLIDALGNRNGGRKATDTDDDPDSEPS